MLATIRRQPNFKLTLTSFLHARCRPGGTLGSMFGKTASFWQFHSDLSWRISLVSPTKAAFYFSLSWHRKGRIDWPLNCWWAWSVKRKRLCAIHPNHISFWIRSERLTVWSPPFFLGWFTPVSRPRSLRSLLVADWCWVSKNKPGGREETRHLAVRRSDVFWQSAQWNESKTSLIPHKTSQTSSSNTSSEDGFMHLIITAAPCRGEKLSTLWPFHINRK